MSAVEVKAKTQPQEGLIPSPNRIRSARFVLSVPFCGKEMDYAVVGPGHAASITPARIEADGSPVPVLASQRSDGLVLEREYVDRLDNKTKTERVFVGWANIRCVVY